MSPVGRKRKNVKRTAEWKIRATGQGVGSNSYVTVSAQADRIRVVWITDCALRTFNPNDMRELIMYVDGTLTRYPEIWLNDRDSNGQEFFAHLEEGKLTGNTEPRANGWADWEDLKHAFEEALNELDSEKEAQKA